MTNKGRKIGLFVLLATGLAKPAQAQEWSFGPMVQLGISRALTVGDQIQINDNLLTTSRDGDANGSSLGIFGRYDRPRWYAQLGIDRGKAPLANVTISGPAGGFPMYPSAIRYSRQAIVGAKPLPWLRLSAGLTAARYNWNQQNYDALIASYEAYVQQYPDENNRSRLEQYQVLGAVQNSFKKTNLEGQLGIGADIGGLMLDLTYNRSLSPVLDGITFQGQPYALRQDYSYWALRVGYRLLPLKSHLLAPRKNAAYQRIKRDIPFYRNEFHLGVGLLGEDIGSRLIYENRYTRYLTRRVGVTGSLTFAHSFIDANDQYSSSPVVNQVSLLAGFRALPLYSHRHIIGLTTGPMLTYRDDLNVYSAQQRIVNGQVVRYVNLNRESANRGLNTGWHSSVDYQFALTDRLVTGVWLRLLGQSFIIPDYANLGIQAGYRF